jgi:cytochrome P450
MLLAPNEAMRLEPEAAFHCLETLQSMVVAGVELPARTRLFLLNSRSS